MYPQTQADLIGPKRIPMDPELLKAARRGDKNLLLKKLLPSVERSHEIAIEIPKGDAPLGHEDKEANILLGVTIGGNTAVHIAATHGHLEFAQMICQRESSLLMARNVMLETPLHCAARAGHDEIVSSIIAFIRDFERIGVEQVLRARNRDGETALHEAARNGHVKVAKVLMSADCELANMADEDGISPLYLAAMAGSLPLLRAILQSFPVSYSGPKGQTALHAAVLLQNSEMAKELLKWNQMLAKRADNSGSTPLHYAASAGKGEMVELLLEHDTTLAYIEDSSGLCPVHVAVMKGKVNVMDKFMEHCPDSDELLDNKGRNLLHTAVEHKKRKIVQYVCETQELVKLINARDYEGNTPLHLAVQNGDQKIVSLLMGNKRLNPSIMNKKGLTPLDLSIIGVERGLSYYMNPSKWIRWFLAQSGARASPHRVDQFLRDYTVPKDLEKESKKHLHMNQSIAISSVVIATVTFAAAFTLPGGYKDDGTPTLAGQYHFKAFIVADTLAFIFSVLSTCWSTFGGSILLHPWFHGYYVVSSSALLLMASGCMVVAFALAMYLVLSPVSNPIAIVVCVATSASLLLETPTKMQMFKLAKAIQNRVRWIGFFKSHPLPEVSSSWLKWERNFNVARFIFFKTLRASMIYIFIFLLALL